MHLLENQKILTQKQHRKATLGMFGNLKSIFGDRFMAYQKFRLRMELVPLVRKPGKVSKSRKLPAKGLSLLVTVPTGNPESVDGAQVLMCSSNYWALQ